MSKEKKKSGIKILAADAKARLKNGYYSNKNLPSQSYHEVVLSSFDSNKGVEYRAFYENVRKIISDDSIINPITRLIDEDYVKTLSYSAKQRYLLEISEKFNRIKKEIMQENNTIL